TAFNGANVLPGHRIPRSNPLYQTLLGQPLLFPVMNKPFSFGHLCMASFVVFAILHCLTVIIARFLCLVNPFRKNFFAGTPRTYLPLLFRYHSFQLFYTSPQLFNLRLLFFNAAIFYHRTLNKLAPVSFYLLYNLL